MRLKWCSAFLLLTLCASIEASAQKSDTNSIESIKAKAEYGDALTQCKLADMYLWGKRIERNFTEALKWYRKAAAQGNAQAEFGIGFCYFEGYGVPQDKAESTRWIRKAADDGSADAQDQIGTDYMTGNGVPPDSHQALSWFKKSAGQGSELGMFHVGTCYMNGDGIAKDTVQGLKLWHEAADKGLSFAQGKLGDCYYYGDSVIKDYVQAAEWYRKAAEQGDCPIAQYLLGLCYFNGFGVARDYVEAYKWLNLAAGQGVEEATKCRTIAEARMTNRQISEGQRLSREFTAHEQSDSNKFISREIPRASGTGFFIVEDGYLITNEHVVRDATLVRLVSSHGLLDAKVIKVDAANDLALLKAEGRFKPLSIASSRLMHLGNSVLTIGFPNIGLQGFAPKLGKGEIASLSGASDDARYFQISVPVQPGNSGGALVDEHGNVVGVVSAKLDAAMALATSGALPENVNYAVKSSFLLSFLESVPEISSKLKEPVSADRKFEDVVQSAQQATVLVLVY